MDRYISSHVVCIPGYISSQDLIDSYLAPFQQCVEKGKVSGLMCSYNAINGIPACANKWLLQDVARDAWGFDGYITRYCISSTSSISSISSISSTSSASSTSRQYQKYA